MLTRKNSIATIMVLVVFVACLFASMASFGFASPITRVEELRVQVSMFNNHPIIIIGAYLPEGATLPAQVPVAVPEGVRVDWVGEIAGTGNPDEDPTTKYELLETKDGWDIYLIEATKHRVVQIEASLTKPYMTLLGNNMGTVEFVYTPATDVSTLIIAAEAPQNVLNYDQKPGHEVYATGPSGGMLYGPTFEGAKAGETYGVSFSFETIDAAEGAQGLAGDSFTSIMIVLIIVLLSAVAALFFIINRQRADGTQAEKPRAKSPASQPKPQQKKSSVQPDGTKKKSSPGSGFKWNSPQMLIIALIVFVSIALFFWASSRNATTITENNGVYSQSFASGDPCESVEFELTDEAMQNPKKAAEDIFRALRTSDIYVLIGNLDSNTGILSVEFCGSNIPDPSGIVRVVEATGLTGAPVGKSLNTPIALDGGALVVYFVQSPPCVVNTFTIESSGADTVAFIQQLANAVKGVPTITGVAYDPATATATFGFCEEVSNDDTIADALEAAGINATLKTGFVDTPPNSILH